MNSRSLCFALIAVLALAMSAGGCQRTHPIEAVAREAAGSTGNANSSRTSQRPNGHVGMPRGPLASVRIKLERTACFGTCPVYSVELRGDGAVVYQGYNFVAVCGRQKYRIPPADVAKLVETARQMDFWSLDRQYRSRVTDNPTQFVSLTIGGQTKVVEDYVGESVGMPPAVTALEVAIDRAAGIDRWINPRPTSGTRSGCENATN
jgi:hypothetical protein